MLSSSRFGLITRTRLQPREMFIDQMFYDAMFGCLARDWYICLSVHFAKSYSVSFITITERKPAFLMTNG